MREKYDAQLAGEDSIIVFDTNVLLTDPNALLAYGNAEIVLPETVLSEIDKLKTARVDPDLRFKGREVTRILFEVSGGQSFVDGIDLPNGGRLRVIPFEHNNTDLPDGFSTKTADDKILATVFTLMQEVGPECEKLTLITNDLNMLLKAQTLGICVSQFGTGDDLTFLKKYLVRPFQRYRAPMTILIIAIAIFAAVLVLAYQMDFGRTKNAAVSTEFKSILSSSQKNAYDALLAIQDNPADSGALLTLANFYYARSQEAQVAGDNATVLADSKVAIRYYEKYLSYVPGDADARADMATEYFYAGNTDRAIQEVAKVLESNPNHVGGNYNLGIFYYFGRRDLTAAASQMKKVMQLTENTNGSTNDNSHALYEQAKLMLAQIEKDQSGASNGTSSLQSTEKSSSPTGQ